MLSAEMRFTCLCAYVSMLPTFLCLGAGVDGGEFDGGVSIGSDPRTSHPSEFDHGAFTIIIHLFIFTSRTAFHNSFVISGAAAVSGVAAVCCAFTISGAAAAAAAACCIFRRAGDCGGDAAVTACCGDTRLAGENSVDVGIDIESSGGYDAGDAGDGCDVACSMDIATMSRVASLNMLGLYNSDICKKNYIVLIYGTVTSLS